MDFGFVSGHGYLLIGGLILVGGGFLLISLFVNRRVAHSVRAEEKHREKLFEYYRNTFSQLGVILIGIGVSLFIFFFQQSYQEQHRNDAELRQLLAKISVRVGRGAAAANSLIEFDELIRDDGKDYIVPTGPELAQLVDKILLVERDVDLDDFGVLRLSDDLATSALAGDLDPVLWFSIAEDESEVSYAVMQLTAEYEDLHASLGGLTPEAAVADPVRAERVRAEVQDVFWDMDVLRDRSRRVLGRGCWFLSAGPGFLALKPIPGLEADYATHGLWIEQAAAHLKGRHVGSESCFDILKYHPEGYPE